MSSTELLILVFGVMFLLYYFRNTRENFSLTESLGKQVDGLIPDYNLGMDYAPIEENELINRMENVLEKEKLVRQQGVKDYKNDVLKAMNIPEFYHPAVDIPFDVKRHEYKFEKKPQNVIDEMEKLGEPLELRKVFNNVVKDYKHVEPTNPLETRNERIDVNPFAKLDDYTHEELVEIDNDLQPINASQSYFSRY